MINQRRINDIKDLPPLKLNDNEIKRVGKVKSLGVISDEGLKMEESGISGKPEPGGCERGSRPHCLVVYDIIL